LTILICPGCGRGGLRVPDGRRGKVTCPRCGAEWFHPETIELSEVEFRCSQNGARFVVQLSRRSPLHKFVIQGISRTRSRTGETSHLSPNEAIASRGTPKRQPSGPKSSRWLAHLFGKVPDSEQATSSQVANAEPTQRYKPPAATQRNADEYNWASFFCPYCNASSFVHCRGGHFACDGTAEIRSGRRFRQCFCGSAGFIDGTIKTIEANQSVLETEPEVAKPSQGDPAIKKSQAGARLLTTSKSTDLRKQPKK
jgi:hypothetical protein